ncbi:MAG: TadE family protein [Bryobacteraceae bacterium]
MSRRGQSLVESTLVLLVFFAMLLGVIDCGQVLYAHQALEERVRSAVRWGAMHPFDGTGEQVASLILYNQPDQAGSAAPGYLGLTRANIQVRYQAPTAEQPDDERISVAIVNYQSHFFTLWIARTIVSPRPVFISSPVSYHAVATR